jgi:hypothetical protein
MLILINDNIDQLKINIVILKIYLRNFGKWPHKNAIERSFTNYWQITSTI